MKIRNITGRALAAALAVCVGLLPALAAEGHTHVWSTQWDADNICHWHKCSDPGCRTLVPAWAEGYAYHVYDGVNDPDCNVCGWVRAVDPGHGHRWGEGWSSDETHHWRQCADEGCPGVVPAQAKDYAPHVYDGAQGSGCSVCGRARFVDPNHTHSWGEEWDSNESLHWHPCTGAGCPGVVPGQAPDSASHIYDSEQDPDCNICGRVRFVELSHTHSWGEEWDSNEGGHWYRCTASGCPGVVPGQAKGWAAHVYDSAQDPDCNICGWARFTDPNHTHTWGTRWEGNESGHWYACTASGCPGVVPAQAQGWGPHIYDGESDPDCNVCGLTRVVLPFSEPLLPPPVPEADVTVVGRGRVYARPANPRAGDKVTVILTPGEHYAAGTLTVTTRSGTAVEAASSGDGTWSFSYPGEKVRFYAVFPHAYQCCGKESGCPLAAYGDLSPAAWYHDGVHYCLDWGLMSGYDPVSFVPGGGLSGGMMAQMLYNLAGRPELPGKSFYTGTGAWYDTAVTWAVGAGVLNVDEGFWKFSPDEGITREQLALMLWRYAGRPLAEGGTLSFPDTGALSPWAVEAVRWAADRRILMGRESGLLDPGGKVTRAEAASMLVRFLEDAQT